MSADRPSLMLRNQRPGLLLSCGYPGIVTKTIFFSQLDGALDPGEATCVVVFVSPAVPELIYTQPGL